MDLDQQQKAAVETASDKALVIAGAGSGKTRVLTERIAYLIERCLVSPYEIMAFTFTRKAAQEMRERLETRLGSQAHKLTIGTIHAIALKMVQRFGELIGLRPSCVTVYGEWEEAFLLKEVAKDIGFFKKAWKVPKKDIDAMFFDYYQRGIEPDAKHPARPIFDAFMSRCRENNSLTYGSLLIALRSLIPVMARHLHIVHLLVDECQDIDELQWDIINRMQQAFEGFIFCVGDVSQSIYKFRGAVPEYLIEHQADFDVYRLENNYRSVPAVVDAANKLISHNSQRIELVMKPTRPTTCEGSEFGFVLNHDSRIMAGMWHSWPDNCAILARNHKLLQRLSEELANRGVEHLYVGRKTALTNSEEFRRFHAFLKLLVNPYDNFSFLLIRDLIGLSAQDFAWIRKEASSRGMSHFQVWFESWHGRSVHADHFFATVSEHYPLGSTTFLVKYMFSGALPFGGDGFGMDVEEVFSFIFQWLSKTPDGTLDQYLSWLATYDIQDEIESEIEVLTLSTIHAAKGLEWNTVVVAGCNDGILPSKQAVASGEIEEERRLMYVAITRARDQCVLAVRPEVKQYGDKVYHNPISRFVGEATT